MDQNAAPEPIAMTSDGQPIFPAVKVPAGSAQPLGVFLDGQPVWPVPYGTVPPGSPVPFGLTSAGQPVWARAVPRQDTRPLWQKKRVLIPAAVFALFVVAGVAGSGDEPTSVRTAAESTEVRDQAVAPVDPAKAAADKAAADQAAVEKAAADKAAAEKAAAEKAAADKAAAEKAAADKAAEEAAKGTVSQQQAARKAADYLDYTSFARSELIGQLEYNGFSTADATWGVDKLNVDWNEQAALKAKDYLEYTAFSRSDLIGQLKYNGFTQAQAEYGVSQTGL